MITQPLDVKEIIGIDSSITKAELFWGCIPILGWMIANAMWGERTKPIVSNIERQLKARSKPESSVWGDTAVKVNTAQIVCKIAAEEMGWPNDYFIPDDPAGVVFWAHEDGLDVECAVMEIEQKLGIKIEGAEVEAWFHQAMGEVINFLLVRQQSVHDLDSVWPPPPCIELS